MRYCPKCFEEYRDEISRCAACDTSLIGREELEKLPEFQRTRGISVRAFVKATTAEDPFDAEAFSDALTTEGIPVIARPRRRSTVDPLTTGTTHEWWEILVPEEHLARAGPILEKRRTELRAAETEAGEAAEAEELEGEKASGSRRSN